MFSWFIVICHVLSNFPNADIGHLPCVIICSFIVFSRYGGIYLDSDIIVLRPLSLLNNSVGMEDHLAGSSLNGAVMAFRKQRY